MVSVWDGVRGENIWCGKVLLSTSFGDKIYLGPDP